MAYALCYGQQKIPHGSVRLRMVLHPPASSRAHRTRTPQAPRLTNDPRRRLLRARERLPLAVAAEKDFPPWKSVYDCFRRWRIDGTSEHWNAELPKVLRARLGRDPRPSAGIVDSQSVETTGVGGNEQRGLDPAKKVDGTKRHLLVDTEGLVLEARLHSARVPDQDGIRLLLEQRRASGSRAFGTCGWTPATRAGANVGPRR